MQSTEVIERIALPAARPPSSSILRGILSFPVALAVALVMLTVLTVSVRFNDPDLWWHLKVGQSIWTTHHLPTTDLFSYTAFGHAWTDHEWLAQLSMFGAFKLGGYQGIMFWLAAFSSIAFLLVYLLCFRMSGSAVIGLRGAVVAWFFATVGLSPRAQILGYGFLAAELLVLEVARSRDRRWLWVLPPIFAVWVNCHGSYVLGLAILGIYLVSSFITTGYGLFTAEIVDKRLRRDYGLTFLLCVLALCVNPVGFRLLMWPFEAMMSSRATFSIVNEWQSPDLHEPRTLAMLAALALALAYAARTRLSIRELLLLFMAGALAIKYVRMIFPFGIIISPILCRFGPPPRRNPGITAANAVMIAACLTAIVHFFPTRVALEDQARKGSPVDAVSFIKTRHLAGPMINDYGFGGYLVWALPEHKVFIDGRGDIFDWTGTTDAYRRWFYVQEDPTILLDKYHIRLCVLTSDAPMNNILPHVPGWKRVYSDHVATVFTRE